MKDQLSNLLIVAFLALALIGLGSYLFSHKRFLSLNKESAEIDNTGLYILNTNMEESSQTNDFFNHAYKKIEELNRQKKAIDPVVRQSQIPKEARIERALITLETLARMSEQVDSSAQASLESSFEVIYQQTKTELGELAH